MVCSCISPLEFVRSCCMALRPPENPFPLARRRRRVSSRCFIFRRRKKRSMSFFEARFRRLALFRSPSTCCWRHSVAWSFFATLYRDRSSFNRRRSTSVDLRQLPWSFVFEMRRRILRELTLHFFRVLRSKRSRYILSHMACIRGDHGTWPFVTFRQFASALFLIMYIWACKQLNFFRSLGDITASFSMMLLYNWDSRAGTSYAL